MKNLLLIILFLAVKPFFGLAQTDTIPPASLNFVEPAKYEIGGVRVKGAEFSDPNAIIAISGFRVGAKIKIPGIETEKAIKSLWRLKLFTNVEISIYKIIGDIAFLELKVQEMPRLTGHVLRKVKKSQHEDLNDIINNTIRKGTIVTTQVKETIKREVLKFYEEKGYLDAIVKVKEQKDTKKENAVKLVISVSRKKKVRIARINFTGNTAIVETKPKNFFQKILHGFSGKTHIKSRKLRKQMKETKEQRRIFSASKFIKSEYETDKKNIINFYNKLGYRDATILSDSVYRNDKGKLVIDINLKEGAQYHFRNIEWKGNALYDTKRLETILGIKKGDVYNTELLEERLRFSQDGRDISSLYLDKGYLAFRIDPVEVAVENDSIDLIFRIFEGPQFTVNRIVINGNDRTHEHVIRREIRTKPGQKFSRAAIIRSQRELMALGYFNPENFGIQTPTNPQRGTVDIVYDVEEKPSDQLELSAGYQPAREFGGRRIPGGLIGTLGVKFSNFAVSDIGKRSAWKPYPQGDGQVVSLRGQMQGAIRKSISASFTEPWLGGRKPRSLSVASSYSFMNIGTVFEEKYFKTFNTTISLGQRLKIPDDNFISSTAVSIEILNLKGADRYFQAPSGEPLAEGRFNNFALIQNFTRSTISYPLFPEQGSKFSFIVKATPPYSLFRGSEPTNLIEKYKFAEYIKFRFNAEWYTSLGSKFVLKTAAKMGYLGSYNKKRGQSPFERFELGGGALDQQTFQITSREFVTLRGYDSGVQGFAANAFGAAIFNKYTMELRYPLSLNPSSTIYVLGFLEAGNAWDEFKSYDPFNLKRSAGLGLRVFLPMFGTIGFDYGLGFDKAFDKAEAPGSKFFKNYGKFNIIIGVEPE